MWPKHSDIKKESNSGALRRNPSGPLRLCGFAPFVCVCVCVCLCVYTIAHAQSFRTWNQYLGGADSSQYSSLDQINRSNVTKLSVAWSYPTGDGSYRFNPIVVDGVLYVLAATNSIVALDAATGKEIWIRRNQGAV